jgi:hypothetical protein
LQVLADKTSVNEYDFRKRPNPATFSNTAGTTDADNVTVSIGVASFVGIDQKRQEITIR